MKRWPFRKKKGALFSNNARVRYVGPHLEFQGKEGVLIEIGLSTAKYGKVLFDSPVTCLGRVARDWSAVMGELLIIVPATLPPESYEMKRWLEE